MSPDHPTYGDLAAMDEALTGCRACPRLVSWREQVAREKRASYADQTYWGRPVPGFGTATPSLLIVGLAPAAHGANRTGRMFTGDRSGDWLYAALHRAGLANQPTSTRKDDGLSLRGVRITSPVHCAPPDNKPLPSERDNCARWFTEELSLELPTTKAMIALGSIGWSATIRGLRATGAVIPRPLPKFGHGASVEIDGVHPVTLFGCYHVSQQNTFTGRLTETMLDGVINAAKSVAGLS